MLSYCVEKAKHLHRFEFVCVVADLMHHYPGWTDGQMAKVLNRSHYSIRKGPFTIDRLDVALAKSLVTDCCPHWPEGELFYMTYKGLFTKGDVCALDPAVVDVIYDVATTLRFRVEHIRRHFDTVQRGMARLARERHPRTLYWKDTMDDELASFMTSARRLIVKGKCVKRGWFAKLWCIPKPYPEIPLEYQALDTPSHRNAYRVFIIIGRVKVCLCRRYQYLRLE